MGLLRLSYVRFVVLSSSKFALFPLEGNIQGLRRKSPFLLFFLLKTPGKKRKDNREIVTLFRELKHNLYEITL